MPAVISPTTQIIRSAERFTVDAGWLLAKWHFSFGHYNDPANMHFSALRVFNDDIVQPSGGFDTHPHRDAEIVTIVLEGKLSHKDSTGGQGTIGPDEVQAITAGRGLTHSEFNASTTDPVHLMQLWFLPRNKGSAPKYNQKSFAAISDANVWRPLVSDGRVEGTLSIDQDVVLYTTRLAAGRSISHIPAAGRSTYVFVIEGDVNVGGGGGDGGVTLHAGDQLRTTDTATLNFIAGSSARLLLIDLP